MTKQILRRLEQLEQSTGGARDTAPRLEIDVAFVAPDGEITGREVIRVPPENDER